MNYVGIDIHKRYSVLCAQEESGQKLREARIEGHETEDYARSRFLALSRSSAPSSASTSLNAVAMARCSGGRGTPIGIGAMKFRFSDCCAPPELWRVKSIAVRK